MNTIPEETLRDFDDRGHVAKPMAAEGGDAAAMVAEFVAAGTDADALAAKLQFDAANSFVGSWQDMVGHIEQLIAGLRAHSSMSALPR